jgi:hypothetical protein
MASADTRGWILTFIFFFAAWLLGSPNESLRQIGKRNPYLASNLEMRLVRRLPQKPGPALNALKMAQLLFSKTDYFDKEYTDSIESGVSVILGMCRQIDENQDSRPNYQKLDVDLGTV